MPDYLKEELQALREVVQRLVSQQFVQQGIRSEPPGRVLGTQVPLAGGSGSLVQNFFTTGYDAVNKVTTVAYVLDFSPLGGTDVLTM